MPLKDKEFIEIEYTGKTKEDEIIFDTTDEKVAKDNELFNEQVTYGPVIVCLGEGHIIQGLDKLIIGKEPGDYSFDILPEDAFGKKDPKFIQLIPSSKFAKQGIKPMPGMQVNVDNHMGIIKTVSGGRTIVDFNHPLSGKEVVYTVKIIKKITDTKKQVEALLKLAFQMKAPEVKEEDGKFKVLFEHELPDEVKKSIKDKIVELTKAKDLIIETKKPESAEKTQ
tara:strand:+ start:1436 stop:2107 length:672 start_codon:yes stop_codon:yes gene_type:complete